MHSPAAAAVSTSLRWTVAFELTDASLVELEQTLTSLGLSNQRTTLRASDSSTLKYDCLSDAKEFPNSPGRRAVSLDVAANSPEGSGALLTFSGSRFGGDNVTIALSGQDEWVLKARRDLGEWVKTTRPAYALVAEASWMKIIFGGMFVFLGYLGWVMRGLPPRPQVAQTPEQTGNLIIFFVACMLLMFTWDKIVERPFRYLFPLGSFTFGKNGTALRERRSNTRNVLVFGVVLAFIVNVASSYFGN